MTAAELAGEALAPDDAARQFREGMLVCHPAFGLGHIAALSGYGDQRKAKVRFTRGDTRTFVLSKSPLQPFKTR